MALLRAAIANAVLPLAVMNEDIFNIHLLTGMCQGTVCLLR